MKIRKDRWDGREHLKFMSNRRGDKKAQHPQVRRQIDDMDDQLKTPSQPSLTNLSDELKELVKRDIAFLLGAKASDIDPDSAAMQIVDEIMSAITAAYAEAIKGCVPEKKDMDMFEGIGDDGGIDTELYDSDDDPRNAKNGEALAHLANFAGATEWNQAIDTFTTNLKNQGLLPNGKDGDDNPL